MKKLLLLIIMLLVLSGCTRSDVPALTDEALNTFPVSKASPEATSSANAEKALEEKFAAIDFYLVAGVYTRNVLQEDKTITEMFTFDKTNFIRIANSEFEQEIFAYNYISDNFTYLYYFEDELISKMVINIDTGAILQDINGYSELLKADAEELKSYFYDLINLAEIRVDEISIK